MDNRGQSKGAHGGMHDGRLAWMRCSMKLPIDQSCCECLGHFYCCHGCYLDYHHHHLLQAPFQRIRSSAAGRGPPNTINSAIIIIYYPFANMEADWRVSGPMGKISGCHVLERGDWLLSRERAMKQPVQISWQRVPYKRGPRGCWMKASR